MSIIMWAGKSSLDVNVVVERYPNQPGPSRRFEAIQIPGRNGDLFIDSGAYDNYIQEYKSISTPTNGKRRQGQDMSERGCNPLSDISG